MSPFIAIFLAALAAAIPLKGVSHVHCEAADSSIQLEEATATDIQSVAQGTEPLGSIPAPVHSSD
jgi:hypothetical protein